ncbi:hypothetical protein CLD20_18235 [Afifella sp. IM 167]|nr:hypothetical protein [Afifella sp. IM 167]
MLFTALIAPYVIDWDNYRHQFEEKVSASLGVPVSVGGEADLAILPTPTLSLGDVRIGPADAPFLTLDEMRAKVELTGLLKGEINVISVDLERPRLSVDIADLAPDGGRVSLGGFNAGQVSLGEMAIRDGEVTVRDSRRGASWRLGDVRAEVRARTLEGPGRLEGGFVLGGERYRIDLAAGRLSSGGTVPLKMLLIPAGRPLTLSTSGEVRLLGEDGPAYEGTFDLSGLKPEEGADPASVSPLALLKTSGKFKLSHESLASEEFSLAYGPEAKAVQVNGEGSISFLPEPQFRLAFDTRQIDLDRALGGGAGQPIEIAAATERLLAGLKDVPVPSIPGLITLDAQGLVVGGSVIQAVGTDIRPSEDGWKIDIFSALLPGATRVDVSGDLATAEPAFRGHGKIVCERPSAFAAWWRGEAGEATRLDRFLVEADLDLSPRQQTARALHAEVGEGTLSGSLSVRRFERTGEAFADVDLAADKVALEDARAVLHVLAGDNLKNGDFARIALALSANQLSAGGAEAQSARLEGVLAGNSLDISALSVTDLAGADITASGRIDDLFGKPQGRLSADVRAENLSGAADFARGLFPSSMLATRLQDRADALSPVDATMAVTAEPDGAFTLDLSGSFGGSRVTLTADGSDGLASPDRLAGRADLLVQSDDTAALASQLGFDVVPLPGSGPARLSVTLEGSAKEGGSVSATGEAAGIGFSFDGSGNAGGTAPALSGTASLNADDLDTALLLAGVALPGVGEGHALSASGQLELSRGVLDFDLAQAAFDGSVVGGHLTAGRGGDAIRIGGELRLDRVSLALLAASALGVSPDYGADGWPKDAFAPALPDGVMLDLAVHAQTAESGVGKIFRNVSFAYRYDGAGGLSLDDFNGDFAGGRMSGALVVGGGDGARAITLRLSLSDALVTEIAWQKNGRSVANGTISASMEVTGRGRSYSGVLSSLNGSGSFTLRDGLLRYMNPQAFGSIIHAADAGLKLEREPVAEAFKGHLDAGTLSFERATGSFAVTSGILRLSTLTLDGAGTATVLGSASVDLNRMTLSSDWSLKVDPGEEKVTGAEPEVGILFSGPLSDPQRRIDVTPFLGFLTVRAFEQEVQRVEKLQAEIQEGDRLRRELRRQREADDRKQREAEDAARAAAEAEQKAKEEEAARQEQQSQKAAEEAEKAREAARAAVRAAAEAAAEEAEQPAESSNDGAPVQPQPQPRPTDPQALGGEVPAAPQPQGSPDDQEAFARRLGRILEEPLPPAAPSPGQPLDLLPPAN